MVLLVEDDLRLSELIRSYLQENGFHVSIENRGDRAIDHAQRLGPDVVILDLGLPGKDGFSVCRELRAASGHTRLEPDRMLSRVRAILDEFLSRE